MAELHFAPMQGYADNTYRRIHADIYGAADAYYTPFIRIEKGAPRRQDISRLAAAANDDVPLTPQIIFNSTDEFNTLASAVKELGFTNIDLNLGCPFPMQTRKGRGAAMIANLETMERIAAIIAADSDTSFSVKMRLGMASTDEWKPLMQLFNELKLNHITIHPRTAGEMYAGELHTDTFAEMLEASANPVIFNGGIATPADVDEFMMRFPGVKGVMSGRGLLGRPSMVAEWREGVEWDHEKRLDNIIRFHDRLLEEYSETLCGDTQILQKIKPFWDHMEPEIGHKSFKAIHKAGSLAKYRSAVSMV